ncbi:hypothetical protein [Mycoplasma struthionis]|uniref:Uncharacterized protein n=1 Tax=Mycoplasma struthionis TaxID=538220 RepID=A0A3G8LHW6_9MOLU|nr:hypothetical protein [Mycoplasma struthionis]AZG68825.1 hypothetical protein EGN60_02585 [Mycoplasma struthionis]
MPKDKLKIATAVVGAIAAATTVATIGVLFYQPTKNAQNNDFDTLLSKAKRLEESDGLAKVSEVPEYAEIKSNFSEKVNKYESEKNAINKDASKRAKAKKDLTDSLVQLNSDLKAKIEDEKAISNAYLNSPLVWENWKTTVKSALDDYEDKDLNDNDEALNMLSDLISYNRFMYNELKKQLDSDLTEAKSAVNVLSDEGDNATAKNDLSDKIAAAEDNDIISIPERLNDLSNSLKNAKDIILRTDIPTIKEEITKALENSKMLLNNQGLNDTPEKADLQAAINELETLNSNSNDALALFNKLQDLNEKTTKAQEILEGKNATIAKAELVKTIAKADEIISSITDIEAKAALASTINKSKIINEDKTSTSNEASESNTKLANAIRDAIIKTNTKLGSDKFVKLTNDVNAARELLKSIENIADLKPQKDVLEALLLKTSPYVEGETLLASTADLDNQLAEIDKTLKANDAVVSQYFGTHINEKYDTTLKSAKELLSDISNIPELGKAKAALEKAILDNAKKETDQREELLNKDTALNEAVNNAKKSIEINKKQKELKVLIEKSEILKNNLTKFNVDKGNLENKINDAKMQKDSTSLDTLKDKIKTLKEVYNDRSSVLEPVRKENIKEKIKALLTKSDVLLSDNSLDGVIRRRLLSYKSDNALASELSADQLENLANKIENDNSNAEKNIYTKKYNSSRQGLEDINLRLKVDLNTISMLGKLQKEIDATLKQNIINEESNAEQIKNASLALETKLNQSLQKEKGEWLNAYGVLKNRAVALKESIPTDGPHNLIRSSFERKIQSSNVTANSSLDQIKMHIDP